MAKQQQPTKRRPARRLRIATVVGTVALVCVFVAFLGLVYWASNAEVESSEEADTLELSDEIATVEEVEEVESVTFTVSVAGDCTLGTDEYFSYSTSFDAKYNEVGDPSYFFANVVDIFSADDLTIVNLEGTLTDSTSRADKTYAFKGDPEYAEILVEGSVEAVCLANNHSHDYGEESYTDTIEAVEAVGIESFGYDDIAYMDVDGVTVALIGTYVLAEGLDIQDDMEANIAAAQEAGAQVIIVYFHWGSELETVPDTTQITLAHAAIDAGADLVVGSHPHVIQGYEEYNGHYIVYSLGNFCFGGNSDPTDYDCMIIQQTFTVTGDEVEIGELTVIPCSVSSSDSINNYQPTPATGDDLTRIEAKIEESNEAIAELSAQVKAS